MPLLSNRFIACVLVAARLAAAADEACTVSANYARGQFQVVRFPVVANDNMISERGVLLYMPSSLPDDGSRTPATLAFHGFHSNPWYFGRLIDITAYAERYAMVVALPFGTSPTFYSALCCPVGCDEACCSKGDQLDALRPCMWNAGGTASHLPHVGGTDDVAMAKAAVDLLVDTACVDRERVTALGFSNGGMMMHRLACEAADVFAGVASISGSLVISPMECTPARSIPWIHLCGTADGGCTKTVNSTFELLGDRNGCNWAPQPTYTSATTHCEARTGCGRGAFVEKCLLSDLGDEVPGHQRQVPFVPQPATNLDAIKYLLDRFSSTWPRPPAKAASATLQV